MNPKFYQIYAETCHPHWLNEILKRESSLKEKEICIQCCLHNNLHIFRAYYRSSYKKELEPYILISCQEIKQYIKNYIELQGE